MKKILQCCVLLVTAISSGAYAQGWYAEIDLDLNHGLYAYEKISSAQVTFSGVTVSGSSGHSNLRLTASGTGAASGSITITATGTAWQPYDPSDPYSQSLPTIHFSGSYDVPCKTAFFQKAGSLQGQDLYIWIKVHPRLQISDFIQLCEQVTLITNTCSPTYTWEVSDSPSGNFKTLTGKSTPSISVSGQDLIDAGFVNPYGRKYFRVRGRPNTTSQVQPIDMYYPGPAASIVATSPTCHNGSDGLVALNIESAFPGVINDFVITLFNGVPPAGQIAQDFINDSGLKTFSGLKAGSYWVRIENNSSKDVYGNCWTDYAVGTLKNPEPVTLKTSVSNYNGSGVRCAGSRDGIIEVMPSGGSGAYSKFEWTPQVSTSSKATNLPAGTFQVKVTDTKGCSSASVSSTVTEPQAISVHLTSSGGKNGYDVSCHNKSDGIIETSVSGGVPGYKYLWSNRSSTPLLKDVSAGDYSVSVNDVNGCGAQAAISLKSPAPINFNIKEISPIHCAGDATGALEIVSITNTIGQIFHKWSSGENEPAIFNKVSGPYTASVSDDQGCRTTKRYVLLEPPVYKSEITATSDYHGAPIRCNGTATGELRATIHDPSGNVVAGQDFTWFRNNAFHQTGQNLETLKAADAATYRVKIRYNTYCTTEAVYMLQEPDPVKIIVNTLSDYHGVAISCDGYANGSIEAAASGGTGALSLKWDTGETTSVLSELPQGTYVVTATDVNGCSAQSQTTLNAPKPVEANLTILSDFNGAAIRCSDATDGELGASAKGGTAPYTFKWSNDAFGTELKNLGAGDYAVTAIDVNGCTGEATSSILAPPSLHAAIIDSSNYNGYGTSCAGKADGFLVGGGSGGTGTYRYQWLETNTTMPLNADLATGTYSLVVMDANGCTAFTRAIITEPKPVIISDVTLKNVSCYKGSDGEIALQISGGTGVYRYSTNTEEWQASHRLVNLESGVYQANARDENGCTITSTQTLSEPEQISIAFTDISPALCGEAIGEISTKVDGGNGGFKYEWTDTNANIVGNSPTAFALSAGIYTLMVTDKLGCQVTDIAGLTSTDGPRTRITEINPATCSNTADGSAKIEVMEGEAPFSFMWDDGQTTSEAVHLRKGKYLVEITDVNHCTTIESVLVPAPDSLIIELVKKEEPRCSGDCDGQISAIAKGGTGPYKYDWQVSSGPVIKDLCAGEYLLRVTDQHACAADQAFLLTQPAPIELTAPLLQSPSCPEHCDGQLELQATGGTGELVFGWSGGQAGPVLTNLCSGDFTAIVKDSRNCTITETFMLEAPQIFHPDLGRTITLCEGQTHMLDAGPEWENYLWSSIDGFIGDARTIVISEAGMYWLEARTAAGCLARDTFLLQTSTDLLKANFLVPTQAIVSDTIVIIDISWPLPGLIAWNFPDEMVLLESPPGSIFGTFADPGLYEISLSAELGACHDDLKKNIAILREDTPVAEAGRLGSENFVKQFTLYPNPNDGMFDVVAEFTEESPIAITVWNVMTSKKIAQIKRSGRSHYLEHIDLRPLSAGSYSLRLDHSNGTGYIRFIVR